MSRLNPDGSTPNLCPVCEVDHRTTSADLSHGLVYLLIHSTERFDWMEHPINGDHVALQRAGILPPSMLWSTDWEQLGEHLNIRDISDDEGHPQ